MDRYTEYKDSGVAWIGEIPAHWNICLVGRLYSIKAGGDAKPELYSGTQDENHPFPVYTNTKNASEVYAYTSKAFHPANSITVTGRGAIGHAIHRTTPFDAIIRLLALTPKSNAAISKFHSYFIDVAIPFTSDSAAIGQLSAEQLRTKYITIPPTEEQQEIARYLDLQLAKIQSYIAERERELTLLETLKKTEISQVVTKGLNPDAPMRDSGIPWIGEIPAHWEIRKIKHLFAERSEKGYPNEPILCSTQKYGVIPQSMYESRVVVVNKGQESLKLVEQGDFVISLRSFQGGIEYAHYRGIISAAYTILKPNDNTSSPYFKYLLKSHPFLGLIQTCVTGIREGQNINYGMLRKNEIMIPPADEQQAIVDYIEERITQIDTYIAAITEEIEQLRQYKQRLISDAVTGKIKVSTPIKRHQA